MNITQINNNYPSFNGYKVQGTYTKRMKEMIEPTIKALSELRGAEGKDVVADFSSKFAFDSFHKYGQRLYQLSIYTRKSEPLTLGEKILDKFGVLHDNIHNVTNHYHQSKSMLRLIDERCDNIDRLATRLNIKK